MCTVHSESIQTLHVFKILCCNHARIVESIFFPSSSCTQYPIITKEKLKYHIDIRMQTLCYDTSNLAPVPPISLDHLWDVTTCGKFNWLDMLWKGTHLCIWGLTADNAYQSENQAMGSKELPVDLRDRIVSRHRFGEVYQKIILVEGSQEHSGLHNS